MQRTTKKVKVAILFGYTGTGLHGMQIQNDVPTIESVLLKALSDASLIAAINANNPNKVSLMRCARTDKGVHALGQVVNLKLDLKNDDLQQAVQDLNTLLPKSFRVWDIVKTTKSFNSKDLCSSRHYHYWMPASILSQDGATQVSPSTLSKIQSILSHYEGTHRFHNFTNKVAGTEAKATRYMISLSVKTCDRQGTQWLLFHIHGQSFMLHQIRKMMAMVIFIIRYDLDVDQYFPHLYEEATSVAIPRAPALGLLLYHPVFDIYHAKLDGLKSTNTAYLERPKIEFSAYYEAMDQFFESVVWPQLLEENADKDSFSEWIDYIESNKETTLTFIQ